MLRILNQSDKSIVMKYLEKHHIECTFLIGNVLEFGLDNDTEIRRCADYYGYFEDSELHGILPFYNLGSCIPHYDKIGAVEAFVEIMKHKCFTYLLGMEKIVKPLYEGIKDFKVTIEYSEDSYFINNNFIPFELEGVEFKDAIEIKMEDAVAFLQTAHSRGFERETSREDAEKALIQRATEEDFIFLIKDEKILAQACVQTFTSRINQIGGVYTLNEEQGRGYCKAIISELCKKIIAKGKTPTLMVRKNNTPAVRAYKSVGFEYYDDYLIIELEA